MPKGRRKGGRKSTDSHSRPPSDEEYENADNWSTASILSDDLSGSIPEDEVAEGVEEVSAMENFEEKVKDCIEGLTQKSAQGRKTCLDGLAKAFSKKYMYDFLEDRKVTVSDALGRCLKKGKGDEQALAAKCCSLLCIQLGQEAESVLSDIQPVLLVTLADTSASLKARGECAIAVAMCAFIASSDMEEIGKVMEAFENIFKASFRKGDHSVPNLSPEVCRLHTCTLTAWSLLLSIAPLHLVHKLVDRYLTRFLDLLHSQDTELRIIAGETIALIYEIGREEDEDFELRLLDELCEILKKLATESHKYRAKKDRRQQKSSFRDILRAVQEGDAPEMTVKFAQESLDIYSWARKVQYNALCHALSSGVYQHLQENILIREVFGLGEPVLAGNQRSSKPTKWERAMYNAAAFKARTKARQKHRDKRSVMVNGCD